MRKALVLLAMLLAASALVACGGDDDSDTTTPESSGKGAADAEQPATGGGGGSATIKLSADPSGALAFDTDQLDAKAGSVTIDFSNPAPIGHDVVVEDSSGEELGKTPVITDSEETLAISDLKPGDYTYFCSVPGHREGGMEGTLTVK
jgi:plastocyanin